MIRKSEPIVLLGVRISSITKTRLEDATRKIAFERGRRVSMSSLVEEILDEWFTKEGM
jgi:hypothetical protein